MLAVVTISYFSLDSAGGSGYLGAFIAGLIVGNMETLGLAMHDPHEVEMRQFAFNLADFVTLIVFVVLGANIPWDAVGENLLPALAVLAVLLLVARPLAVLACVLPDRGGGWERNEIAFLCWTRETGVIPAALVGVLAGLGVPHIDDPRERRRPGDHPDPDRPGAAGAVAGGPPRPARGRPGDGDAAGAGGGLSASLAGRVVLTFPDGVRVSQDGSPNRSLRTAAGSGRPPTA